MTAGPEAPALACPPSLSTTAAVAQDCRTETMALVFEPCFPQLAQQRRAEGHCFADLRYRGQW